MLFVSIYFFLRYLAYTIYGLSLSSKVCLGRRRVCYYSNSPESSPENSPTANECNYNEQREPVGCGEGVCGCGIVDTDSDLHGTLTCSDGCPKCSGNLWLWDVTGS